MVDGCKLHVCVNTVSKKDSPKGPLLVCGVECGAFVVFLAQVLDPTSLVLHVCVAYRPLPITCLF